MTQEEQQKITDQYNALYLELFNCGDNQKKIDKVNEKIEALNREQLALLPENPTIKVRESAFTKLLDIGFTEEEIRYMLKIKS